MQGIQAKLSVKAGIVKAFLCRATLLLQHACTFVNVGSHMDSQRNG